MVQFILASMLLLTPAAFAGKKHSHRHHDSHEHGSAKLSIAFEGLAGKIEFIGASEGVLGFEHEVKSESDKKQLSDAIKKFETEIGTMIQFDSKAGCQLTKDKIENLRKGSHSDFIAHYSVKCAQSVRGTKMNADFSKFPRLKEVECTLLLGDLQKQVELKKFPTTIDLGEE